MDEQGVDAGAQAVADSGDTAWGGFWQRVLPASERHDVLWMLLGVMCVLGAIQLVNLTGVLGLPGQVDISWWVALARNTAGRTLTVAVAVLLVLRLTPAPRATVWLLVASSTVVTLFGIANTGVNVVAERLYPAADAISVSEPFGLGVATSLTSLVALALGAVAGAAAYELLRSGDATRRFREIGFVDADPGAGRRSWPVFVADVVGWPRSPLEGASRIAFWLVVVTVPVKLVEFAGGIPSSLLGARWLAGASDFAGPSTFWNWYLAGISLATWAVFGWTCFYAVRRRRAPRSVWLALVPELLAVLLSGIVYGLTLLQEDVFFAILAIGNLLLAPIVLAPGMLGVYLATREEAATMDAPNAGEALGGPASGGIDG